MESKLEVTGDGRLLINGVEVPFATLVDVHIAPMELMEAVIRVSVSTVDIPGYSSISRKF